MSNNELMHYGVPGMRWGHRKAQKYSSRAAKDRQLAKQWDDAKTKEVERLRAQGKMKKAARAEADYNKYADAARNSAKNLESKAKLAKEYAKRNEKQADIKAQRTMGAKIATNLWAGPFANRTYNAVRAAGGSKGKAFAVTTATAMLGGPLGHIAVAELYGHGVFGEK